MRVALRAAFFIFKCKNRVSPVIEFGDLVFWDCETKGIGYVWEMNP